jgi:hypothetical protein
LICNGFGSADGFGSKEDRLVIQEGHECGVVAVGHGLGEGDFGLADLFFEVGIRLRGKGGCEQGKEERSVHGREYRRKRPRDYRPAIPAHESSVLDEGLLQQSPGVALG